MCKQCGQEFDIAALRRGRKSARARGAKAEITDRAGSIHATGVAPTARSRNWSGPFRKTPGRLFGMGLVRFYQLTLSGFIGNACRHMPTCSEYGYEAVARHGLWHGGFMTAFRVVRCGPGGTSGFDPVPEVLHSDYRWWAPWRLWQVSRQPDQS